VIVITNQPAVGMGIITMDTLMDMHARMIAAVDKASTSWSAPTGSTKTANAASQGPV